MTSLRSERDDARKQLEELRARRASGLTVPPASVSPTPATSAFPQTSAGLLRSRSPSRATHSSSGSASSIPSSVDSFASSQPSAFMRVPTRDGLILEFDPLSTAPEELEALEGITDSAKKQAKEDMTKLVQAALARWKI